MNEAKTVYLKNGRKWEHYFTCTDREMVYEDLAKELARKYLFGFPNKRIIQKNAGNGTRTITVYESIFKTVYTVAWQ